MIFSAIHFKEIENKVLKSIFDCYAPNSHLGAKPATQKRKYTSHTGKYFVLSTPKEIKKSGERAPLKNHVHSTQESKPRAMSDPPYGLIYCAEWAQKWIHTHQENPTQALRTTNILNSNLHYHFLSHQLENCIHPNSFTLKN